MIHNSGNECIQKVNDHDASMSSSGLDVIPPVAILGEIIRNYRKLYDWFNIIDILSYLGNDEIDRLREILRERITYLIN